MQASRLRALGHAAAIPPLPTIRGGPTILCGMQAFIGLGANPPTPSWGMMIAEGFKAMRSHPHLAIYPGIALAIVMFAFNFLGDGLRDHFDARQSP